jgi:beta-lactamase regulating signal transducer with metallopeptidase domain
VNSSAAIAVGVCLLFVVPLLALVARRMRQSRASARCRRALDSPDGRYRQAYARKYANQYTPPEEDALIRSTTSQQN